MHLANLFNVASYKHLFLCNSLVFHVGTRGDDFVEFYYLSRNRSILFLYRKYIVIVFDST